MVSEVDLQQQVNRAIDLSENTRQYGYLLAPNFLDGVAAIIDGLEGDYSVDHLNAVEGMRTQFAGVYSTATVSTMLAPLFIQYAAIIGSPFTDMTRIFNDLRTYMHDTAQTIQERNITFGPAAAGGANVGDGTIHRLSVDKNGYSIEAVHLETKTARCVQDQYSNAQEQEETFELKGDAAYKDQIKIDGSGLVTQFIATSMRASESFLTNPGFENTQYTDLATITDLGGWDTGTGDFTGLELSQTQYRGYPGIGDTPLALKFTDNQRVFQLLDGRNFDVSIPAYAQIALKRENACDGDVEMKLGNLTVSVNLAAQADWFILKFPLDENLWYDSFNVNNLEFSVELKNNTVGELLLDDVTFSQMIPFDRTFWIAVGGPTPFLREDEFTFIDALAGPEAIIQHWLWRAFTDYLPSSAAPTWLDP